MKIGIAFTLKSETESDQNRPDDWQEEYDSPATVRAIGAAIAAHGHTVVELGDGRPFIERMLADPPDLVFNIAEGRGIARSREARVPAVCEMFGVPCTASDPLTLAVALDKDIARRLVAAAGIAVPEGFVVAPGGDYDPDAAPYPAIVKPAWEGSSKGVRGKCIVRSPDELADAIDRLARDYQQPLLVEEFIAGDEVTVGVVGNSPPEVLGMMRVVPKRPTDEFVYSLEVKRDWENQVRYEVPPADYDEELISVIGYAALTAYRALGCRDVARIDFRVREAVPYFLEANPLPGLNPDTGDLLIIAKGMGVSHAELIGRILSAAMKRFQI